jgi:hypothetical protein
MFWLVPRRRATLDAEFCVALLTMSVGSLWHWTKTTMCTPRIQIMYTLILEPVHQIIP